MICSKDEIIISYPEDTTTCAYYLLGTEKKCVSDESTTTCPTSGVYKFTIKPLNDGD